MQGIRPENLTARELVRLAYAQGTDKLPPEWVAELLKRLEEYVYKDR